MSHRESIGRDYGDKKEPTVKALAYAETLNEINGGQSLW
jgi:hypothetical protein